MIRFRMMLTTGLLLLSGCANLEVRTDILNPDAAGRVAYDSRFLAAYFQATKATYATVHAQVEELRVRHEAVLKTLAGAYEKAATAPGLSPAAIALLTATGPELVQSIRPQGDLGKLYAEHADELWKLTAIIQKVGADNPPGGAATLAPALRAAIQNRDILANDFNAAMMNDIRDAQEDDLLTREANASAEDAVATAERIAAEKVAADKAASAATDFATANVSDKTAAAKAATATAAAAAAAVADKAAAAAAARKVAFATEAGAADKAAKSKVKAVAPQVEAQKQALAQAFRSITSGRSLATSEYAYAVVSARKEDWAPDLNRALGQARLGNSDIVIKLDEAGEFTVKGMQFDPKQVASVASKVTVQSLLLAAKIAGVPVGASSVEDSTGKTVGLVATGDADIARQTAMLQRAASVDAKDQAVRDLAQAILIRETALTTQPNGNAARDAADEAIVDQFQASRPVIKLDTLQ